MAERIAHLQSECGLNTSVEEFKEQYHFGLVEAVFEWARGMPFSEITNLTDVQEGTVVKSFSPKDVAKGLYGAVKPPTPQIPHPSLPSIPLPLPLVIWVTRHNCAGSSIVLDIPLPYFEELTGVFELAPVFQ